MFQLKKYSLGITLTILFFAHDPFLPTSMQLGFNPQYHRVLAPWLPSLNSTSNPNRVTVDEGSCVCLQVCLGGDLRNVCPLYHCIFLYGVCLISSSTSLCPTMSVHCLLQLGACLIGLPKAACRTAAGGNQSFTEDRLRRKPIHYTIHHYQYIGDSLGILPFTCSGMPMSSPSYQVVVGADFAKNLYLSYPRFGLSKHS